MPTGYTAKLIESGQSFEEFALLCARAFGACVMMRDDDMDAPIPTFEPSSYYKTAENESREKLDHLSKLTAEQQIAYGEQEKARVVAMYRSMQERETRENERIDAMLSKVQAWIPPTSDHVGLKDFMIQQLTVSRHNDDYIREQIAKHEALSPLHFFGAAVREAQSSLNYAIEGGQKEVARTNERNEWVRQLRESVSTRPATVESH